MAYKFTISTNNYSGYFANITYYPSTGGTIGLGFVMLPYIYYTEYYYGQYSIDIIEFNKTCVLNYLPPTPTTTPTPTLTPTNTQTPTPTPTNNTVVSTCAVLYNDSDDKVWAYNVVTGDSTELTMPSQYSGGFDIAHTPNKLWEPGGTSFYEYNITLSPFTSTFNREIIYPSGFSCSVGLAAISDDVILAVNNSTSPIEVVEINISGVTTGIMTTKFPLILDGINRGLSNIVNSGITGDFFKTTTEKFLALNYVDVEEGFDIIRHCYLTQWDYSNGGIEVDVPLLSPITCSTYGIFENNGNIYITDTVSTTSTNIYLINTSSPYGLTLVDNVVNNIAGASQIPSCLTVNLNSVDVPTLVTATIVNITTTSATSGGVSINANNGTISDKGVQWSATQNFAIILGSISNGTGTGDFSSNLTSLTPNNTYWIRAFATNEAGTGYGSPLSFITAQTVVLNNFDYIIVTYQYNPPTGLDYDLDTLTTFRYPTSTLSGTTSSNTTGFITGTGVVGCGASTVIPIGRTFNNSYLYFGGDDAGQTVDGAFGESVVINFKNLANSGLLTSDDVIAELFAGWHSGPSVYPISIKYETFIGGTISRYITPGGVITNRFISDGTVVVAATISDPINVIPGSCTTGVNTKRRMASISYNVVTDVASISFLSYPSPPYIPAP